MFLRHPGRVLSREQLLSRARRYDYDPASNVVEVYVRYLRNKIGRHWISTIRGAGHRLVKAQVQGQGGGNCAQLVPGLPTDRGR